MSYTSPNYRTEDPNDMITSTSTWNRQMGQITPIFRVQKPAGQARPYLTGGSGLYIFKESYTYEESGSRRPPEGFGRYDFTVTKARPGFNLGIGMDFRSGDNPVALNVEGRIHGVVDAVFMFTLMAGITFR